MTKTTVRVEGHYEVDETPFARSYNWHPSYVTLNKSRRSIKLTTESVNELRRHRERQLEERERLTGLWQDQGLVFTTGVGTPINRHNLLNRSFKPILEKAGLPHSVRFHDLRHTCATLLLAKGIHPKLVQELLGHSNVSITLDTYSHTLPGMGNQVANAMDDTLSHPRGP